MSSNRLTKAEFEMVSDLRQRGFSVCIFNPDELRGADQPRVEESMCIAGFARIEHEVGPEPEDEGE